MDTLINTYAEILGQLKAEAFNLGEDKYSGVFLPFPSPEYWNSSVKIMLVGRETAGWNTKNDRNTVSRILGHVPDITLKHVIDEANKRYKMHHEALTRKLKSRSHFTRYHLKLAQALDLSPQSVVYANLLAWDYNSGTPLLRPRKEREAIISASLNLLAAQIRHFKPDFIVFASGISRTDYIIKDLLKLLDGHKTVSVEPGKLWEFTAANATCFRIAHPRASHGHPPFRIEVIERIKRAIT